MVEGIGNFSPIADVIVGDLRQTILGILNSNLPIDRIVSIVIVVVGISFAIIDVLGNDGKYFGRA
jgi:hypothetical protein